MDYLTPLWDHQLKKAIEPSRRLRDMALFWEMGTGKTGAVINIMREHYAREKRLIRTLILGPMIVVKNWQDEIRKHSKVRPFDVIPLVGSQKKRIQTLLDACTDPEAQTLTRGKILVTNYEAMEMSELHSLLCKYAPEILVCDESQRLKNGKSVRAKGVVGLLGEVPVIGSNPVRYTRNVRHCYILSGTPILNSAMDIFHQYRILDSGESFGLNFYQFRGTYFEDLNAGMPSNVHFPKYSPRPETYELLTKRIYRKATRVLKRDCLDLPEIVRKPVYVELSKEQRRLYDEMKKDFITWVKTDHPEPRAVVAQMAITKMLRLQQIVSGFVKTEDGKEVSIKENPRLDALAEMIGEITESHKVIVWATFHHNYRQIAEICQGRKIKYVELHGSVSSSDKNKNIETFQRDPDCRVIIANQHAAGIGVNLVEDPSIVARGRSSYSIFYSKNFSLDDDKQAESRNHRGGAEVYESITRIDLIAPSTIDELITQALADKQNIADQVLGWTDRI